METNKQRETTEKATINEQSETTKRAAINEQSETTDKAAINEQSEATEKATINEQSETTDKAAINEQSEITVKTVTSKHTETARQTKNENVQETKGENAGNIGESKKERVKRKKVWLWIAMVLLLILVIVYCLIANYYKMHFFQKTTINNIYCGNLTAEQVAAVLDRQAVNFRLEINGRNENGEQETLGSIQASDIGYAYIDTLSGVRAILEQQNQWLWVISPWNGERGYSLIQGITYDEEKLEKAIMGLDSFQENQMIMPQNAYISDYSEQIGGYEIIPEIKGTKFDVRNAISCIKAAIVGNSAAIDVQVNLVEQGCYEEPRITSDDKEMVKAVQTINQWLSTEIVYDWNGSEVIVDNTVIKDWVSLKNGKPTLDEEAVAAFVNEKALENDTTGKTVRFTTALGIDVNLKKLSYGWKTDRTGESESLIGLIYAGAKETREPSYLRKGVWKGQNDIGNSYIEADLTHQHLYVYEKGSVVFETDFVSGNINIPGCVTPAGIFGLTYKTTNAVLRGADYETPVNYWMPFYGNFGMHDATWRSEFGGDIYTTNGSHGCLNLPLDAAEVIYGYVSEGSPIICYYY